MAANLAARVKSNAVAQKDPATMTVFDYIEASKSEIARALPKHLDPDRIARIALTLFKQTPGLQRCTPQSFIGALMTASQLGLEPGPLGEAYLVPYGTNVTFIPGYRGLIKLAWQSGLMKSIAAHVVHEGDEFDYAYGLEPFLTHKPNLRGRGDVIAVYACAVMKDGGSAFVVMSLEDVEAIRNRSKASKSGPWVTDWNAMACKTAVKQMIRWLPLSTEMRQLGTAAEMDGSIRTDYGQLEDSAYVSSEVVRTEQGPTNTMTGEVVELTEENTTRGKATRGKVDVPPSEHEDEALTAEVVDGEIDYMGSADDNAADEAWKGTAS